MNIIYYVVTHKEMDSRRVFILVAIKHATLMTTMMGGC